MVFKDFLKRITKKRDVLDPKGLEKFSPGEQEKILNRLSTKQAEIERVKADEEFERRATILDRRAGIRKGKSRGRGSFREKGRSVSEKFKSIKEFREKNLKRRAMNLEKQAKLETRLGIGIPKKAGKKLEVKPFTLNPTQTSPKLSLKGSTSLGKAKTILKSPPLTLR